MILFMWKNIDRGQKSGLNVGSGLILTFFFMYSVF